MPDRDRQPLRTRLFTARRKTTQAHKRATAPVAVERERRDAGPSPRGAEGVRLADLAADVLAAVMEFRAAAADARPSYRTFRQDIGDLLTDFQRRAERAGLDRQDHARFALVGLVDESAMTAEWEGAANWKRDPLQVDYFGKFIAGEEFFQRADEIARGEDRDLMEVYFLCLCAGFVGEKHNDPDGLWALRKRLAKRVATVEPRDTDSLTPGAYGHHLERPLLTRRLSLLWALPFVLGAIGLYAAYYVTLDRQVEAIPDAPAAADSAAS